MCVRRKAGAGGALHVAGGGDAHGVAARAPRGAGRGVAGARAHIRASPRRATLPARRRRARPLDLRQVTYAYIHTYNVLYYIVLYCPPFVLASEFTPSITARILNATFCRHMCMYVHLFVRLDGFG